MSTVLVAGASSGIGLETSRQLAKNGCRVIMVARNLEHLQEACNSLEKLPTGEEHVCLSFDFSCTEKIEEFCSTVCAQYEIDGFVYCVGIGNSKRIKDLRYEVLLPVMRANFFSFIELVRSMVQNRKDRSKQFNIVAVSSIASTHVNTKYYTAYSSSKAALESSIRVLAPELAMKKCSICAVKPATVDTPRIDADRLLHPDLEEHLKKSGFQPGGVISTQSVASCIVMLLNCKDLAFSGAMLPINACAVS